MNRNWALRCDWTPFNFGILGHASRNYSGFYISFQSSAKALDAFFVTETRARFASQLSTRICHVQHLRRQPRDLHGSLHKARNHVLTTYF